jgi:adenosylcobalamin-dependent ribonucleoside-triphosphate reductase
MSKSKPDNPIFLSDQTLNKAFKNPDGPLTQLGRFIFYSKYSRWREDMRRREYWAETSQRSVEYNVNLAIAHLEEKSILSSELVEFHRQEMEDFFDNQFNTRQFLSGRTLWTGGTQASYLNPMSNFNCSFIVLDDWKKLGELCHLGMVGTGIGFRILIRDVRKLAKVKARNWKIVHKEYEPLAPEDRHDHSFVVQKADGTEAALVLGDSKEGWRQSIDEFFDIMTTNDKLETLEINYDSIRPEGERLKRFGGRAGGPHTIEGMFDKFHKIITGQLTADYPKIPKSGRVKGIHALDLANAIGKNIVSGGVRSIAEIALLDEEDKETIEAKDSKIFGDPNLNHRFVSNNSVYYERKPSAEQFDWQFEVLQFAGEPCFVNAEVAHKRRPNFNGVNPCVEILLDDRGLCNLTTTNIMAFVKNGKLLLSKLLKAMAMSARAGLRMTLPTLELPEWDAIQQRDRLLGVSVTAWMDAMDAIGYDLDQQVRLMTLMRQTVRQAADEYADLLGVSRPLLTTAVKPEGTISQLAGGVSSGLHVSHASNYLRRVRSAAADPISHAVFDHGWRMFTEQQDNSTIDQLNDVFQYMPWVEEFDPTNVYYGTHLGRLKVRVTVKQTADRGLENYKRMLDAYYDGRVRNIAYGRSAKGLEYRELAYEVDGIDYKTAYGKSTKVVIDFPLKSPAKRTKDNFGAIEQLEMYKAFLHNYTEHNPSNTISVRDHEWKDVKEWVKENWDSMLAVSFLSLFDAPYPLLPYQTTTEHEVDYLKSTMKEFDVNILMEYDKGEDAELVEAGCEGGACPVR